MSIDELSSELNKIDTNQQNWLEQQEIDEFLMNDENVRALWNIMQNICDTQPEVLSQFKESTSKICEKILKNDNISINQWKILLFYLKYFHNENDKLWNKIIKSATKNIRYNATLNAISMENITKDFNERLQQERERRINEWFDNLPWVKAAREDMERQSRDLRKCLWLLDSEDRLNNEDIARLKEYKDSSETMLAPEDRDRLERRLKLEETDNSISEEIDSRVANNPLSNLDRIDATIGTKKLNWSKIVQDIKTPEDVAKIITEENISEYLPIKIEWQLQDNLWYIVRNFQNILAKHLCLHPHYKQWWWVNPDAFITWIDLKNIVAENNLYESAISKIQKWKNQKVSKITEILNWNNHILFDLYLRQKIWEWKDEESRWKIFFNLMKEAKDKNLAKLEHFSRSNSYIKDVLNKYNEAIKEQNEAKRIWDIINQAKEFTVPSNLWLGNKNITKMRMFSMDQIRDLIPEYNKQKAKENTS